jgi:uncharacterized protein (DUF58 family)
MFKRRSRLTQEGWYFVVVLALVLVRASMKDINLMLAFAGMMVGALYFNWLALRMMFRRLSIRRRLPESVAAGDLALIEFEATGPHRATAVVIDDSFQLSGSRRREDHESASAIFPQIGRGQPARAEYRVRFGRRGRYEFGPIRATSRFPLRLVSRTISFPARDEFVVLPRLGRLTNRWTQVRRGPEPGPRRVLQRHGLTEGDFYGMRDWRAGDSRRWIHWRTSARRGKLMVRQFEQPRSENLTLLLELWRPERPEPRDEDIIELAVSFAATIAADVCRRGGCQLRVGIAGEELIALGGGASRALARDVLERLALAEASPREQLGDLVRRGLENGPVGGRIVLISTRPASSDESDRIAAAAATPQVYSALSGMLRVDASGDELFDYFQID